MFWTLEIPFKTGFTILPFQNNILYPFIHTFLPRIRGPHGGRFEETMRPGTSLRTFRRNTLITSLTLKTEAVRSLESSVTLTRLQGVTPQKRATFTFLFNSKYTVQTASLNGIRTCHLKIFSPIATTFLQSKLRSRA
jgi:hypothetical protein